MKLSYFFIIVVNVAFIASGDKGEHDVHGFGSGTVSETLVEGHEIDRWRQSAGQPVTIGLMTQSHALYCYVLRRPLPTGPRLEQTSHLEEGWLGWHRQWSRKFRCRCPTSTSRRPKAHHRKHRPPKGITNRICNREISCQFYDSVKYINNII